MEELKLTFVNVGYGEAALLECPDPDFPGGTFVMVIDGGSAEAEEYRDSATGRIPLDQYLSLRGVDHIDLMAATHVHEDHLCGLLPAAEKLPPAALWQTLPPEFCRSMRTLDIPAEGLTPSRSKFLRALNDYRRLCLGQSCPRHRPLAGMELRLCRDLLVRVLGPSRAQAEKLASSCRALYEEADPSAFWQRLDQLDAAMNNYSLILLLEYRGTRILLPGDTNHRAGPRLPAGRPLQGGPPRPAGRYFCRTDPGHRSPGGGVLRIQRPPLQQRRSGHPADDGGQRRTAVLFRLPARSGRRSPAPPSGPDVHSRRRRRNGGHIPVHPGLSPRSNTTYLSAPALHILPRAGRKKEENPAWLAVRQCGDLPQRRTGPGRP